MAFARSRAQVRFLRSPARFGRGVCAGRCAAFGDIQIPNGDRGRSVPGDPLVATWDDHEVNDAFDPAYVDEGRSAFLRAVPQRSGPSGGIWRKLSWGSAVDVFVLDCRGERVGEDYLGEAQMAWG